jgi:hypothetical protein
VIALHQLLSIQESLVLLIGALHSFSFLLVSGRQLLHLLGVKLFGLLLLLLLDMSLLVVVLLRGRRVSV